MYDLVPGYRIVVDRETGEYWLAQGSDDDWKTIAPLTQGALIQDSRGNRTDVSEDGALKAGDWADQPPLMGTDATGADTYATVLIAPRQCRYMAVTVATNPAIISLNGGATDHLALAAGNSVFSGLDIPAASTIQAKNQNAGNNYTLLAISIW